MKRGSLFFTVDTLIAGIIIVFTAIVLLGVTSSDPVIGETVFKIKDFSSYMFDTQMIDVSFNVYQGNRQNVSIRNLHLHEMVSMLYHLEDASAATQLVSNAVSQNLEEEVGFMYTIDNTTIYKRSIDSQGVNTNMTNSFITFFNYEGGLVGPNVTKITIWQ